MFSVGEIVVLVVAAAWAFGPNELPRVARAAGRLTGQATGLLYRTRAKFFKFAEETEMNKLHEEMQATMYQLNAIRSELQGGINLFQPGPITQRVLSIKPMPGRQPGGAAPAAAAAAAGATPLHQPGGAAAAPAIAAAQGVPQAAAAAGQLVQQRQPGLQGTADEMGSWAASAILSAERQQQVHRLQQLGAAHEAQQQPAQQAQQQHGQQQQQQGDEGMHPLTVPVSAVAAGWAPDRSGKVPTGSEVLLDALAEELLAAQVLRLQQQQMAAQARQAAAQRQAAAATASSAVSKGESPEPSAQPPPPLQQQQRQQQQQQQAAQGVQCSREE